MQYWLMKSEPDVYGIDDLKREKVDHWDGIRNYQVRNMIRDQMKKGDNAFFYHSSCEVPGIAGIMTIASEPYPDHTAFDRQQKYFDPKSDRDKPRWYMIDVRFKRKLKRVIPLVELKERAELSEMPLVRRGNRLSVTPVTEKQWQLILKME
ncbi:MAG: EVE domain-containing protein [Gammaproteobacteria bacterium]